VPDYGALGLMPVLAVPPGMITPDTWRATFDHREESAEVGRYSVTLGPSRIQVDIGATPHTALYVLSYPSASGALVIDLGHSLADGRTREAELTVDASGEVSGRLLHAGGMSGRYGGFPLHFVMRFDSAPTEVVPFARGGQRLGAVRTATGADAGVVLGFAASKVRVQVGLSFVDVATARANLEAEWLDYSLETAVARAREAWAPLLSVAAIEGGTEAERRSFYSALYRVHHMPTAITEAGGKYRGIDGQVAVAEGWTYHTDLSLWDTFRTVHPLFTLLGPVHQRNFARSLVAMTVAGGMVPRWPLGTGETWTMIGSHGESAIIDGWVKGVRDFDVDALWSRVWPAVNGTSLFLGETRSSRECIQHWTTRNYCPTENGGGTVSRTLENSYNDWLLAELAEGLGKTAEAEQLRARAGGWANLYDPSTGFLRGKSADGTFVADFDEAAFSEEYTEGNARQWLVYVPHDLPGLAARMGGDEALVSKLEAIVEPGRVPRPAEPDRTRPSTPRGRGGVRVEPGRVPRPAEPDRTRPSTPRGRGEFEWSQDGSRGRRSRTAPVHPRHVDVARWRRSAVVATRRPCASSSTRAWPRAPTPPAPARASSTARPPARWCAAVSTRSARASRCASTCAVVPAWKKGWPRPAAAVVASRWTSTARESWCRPPTRTRP
jgi:predicted alpha-1,2-mannosidase